MAISRKMIRVPVRSPCYQTRGKCCSRRGRGGPSLISVRLSIKMLFHSVVCVIMAHLLFPGQSIGWERVHARKRVMGSDGVLMMNAFTIAGFGLLLAMATMAGVCVAVTQFKVGGSSGWDLNGPNYQIWADGNTYHIGDILVFTYGGMHSVVETDAAGFQACTPSNAILQDSSGNTAVPLQSAGKHYFMCATPGHCAAGMKFSVTVLPSGSSNTTTGGASIATPSSPATTTTTTTATPPIITVDSATAVGFRHAAIIIPVASILLLL